MKKLLLLAALGISLCANAQLTVFENGNVHVGNYSAADGSSTSTLDISSISSNSLSSTSYPSGSISFGSGSGARIYGCSNIGSLCLSASKMINLGLGQTVNIVSISTIGNSVTSLYDVKAPTFLTTSDMRLKTNVESLSERYSKLLDVNAVSYNLSSHSSDQKVSAMLSSEAESEACLEDQRTHFGFIAQEIQEIYPNLVVEDEEGILAIDYTGFIPLLVEAYKDLSNKVKEQEEIITTLAGQKGPSYMPASVNSIMDQKAQLKQNKPNPFNSSTTIECSLPESVASAFICVYDLQGSQVIRLDIHERGTVNTVIDASSLRPGMYIYSLIADGIEVDSKRMIITD